ncbi:MAG: Bax inhibitor-1 family protein [Verrucomicrobiota bacterium]
MNQSYAQNPYITTAAEAAADERAAFIRRVYLHLAGALLAFGALCTAIQVIPAGTTADGTPATLAIVLTSLMLGTGFSWLIVIGAFIGVGYLANRLAHSGAGAGTQYLGLALYIAAMSVVITPLLTFASWSTSPDLIPMAGVMTLALFGGLTLVAFTSGVNFTFLGGAIRIGFFIALGMILLSFFMGSFTMSIIIAGGMLLLLGMSLLYETSAVMHEYPTNMHVGASLALFSSVAMMFYYVLYLLLSLSRD